MRLLLVAAGAMAAVATLGLLAAESADASHLRGGTLAWKPERLTTDPLGNPQGWEVNVTGQIFWRWTWYNPRPVMNQTYCEDNFDMGDSTTLNYCKKVIYIDTAEDWMIFEIVRPTSFLPGVLKTYTPGPTGNSYLVTDNWSCRIGAAAAYVHINNPCLLQQLQARITLPAPAFNITVNSSPRVFIPPIYTCPQNNMCRVPIAAWDPDNNPITFRWSTAAEAANGAGWTQPGPPDAPNAATIQATPPEVLWDTTGAQVANPVCRSFYSAQLMAQDQTSFVPMDWFIRICPDEPPYWVDPPSPCVHLGHPYVQFMAGIMNSYTVEARHNISSRMVSMFLSPITPLPPGATQTFPPPGNPISSTLFWNPDASLTGQTFPVSYYAYSGSIYAPICTVNIRVVSQPPVPIFVCATPQTPYLRVLFDEASTDPDSNLALWEWDFGDGTSQAYSTPTDPVHDYPAKGWYNVTLRVTDATGAFASLTRACYAHNNFPPILDPIGDKTVYEESTLTFTISGRDPDNDPVGFYWARGPLPAGARFDPQQLLFTWTPVRGMRGEYEPVHFRIVELTSDARYDWENIRITVLPIPDPVAPVNSDSDGDGVSEAQDVCPNVPNPGQEASCGTSVAPGAPADRNDVPSGGGGAAGAGDAGGAPTGGAAALDSDGDRIADEHDNCPTTPNTSQLDQDRDALGDACDPDLENDGVTQVDALGRLLDNCPFTFNPDQAFVCRGDIDADGIPDDVDDCVAYGPLAACLSPPEVARLMEWRAPTVDPNDTGKAPTEEAVQGRSSAPWLVVGAVAAVALGAVAVAAVWRRRE